jgi:hypothetical protein
MQLRNTRISHISEPKLDSSQILQGDQVPKSSVCDTPLFFSHGSGASSRRFDDVLPDPPSQLTPPIRAFREPVPARVVAAVNPLDNVQNEPRAEPKSGDCDNQLQWPDYGFKYGSKSEQVHVLIVRQKRGSLEVGSLVSVRRRWGWKV